MGIQAEGERIGSFTMPLNLYCEIHEVYSPSINNFKIKSTNKFLKAEIKGHSFVYTLSKKRKMKFCNMQFEVNIPFFPFVSFLLPISFEGIYEITSQNGEAFVNWS